MRRSRNKKQLRTTEPETTMHQADSSRRDLKWFILVIALVPVTAISLAIFTSGGDSSGSSSLAAKAPSSTPIPVNTFSVPPARPAATQIASGREEFSVPLADLKDGKARFFEHLSQAGTLVRFFAIQTAVGGYEAALDGCTSCYSAGLGYVQQGAYIVCRKCGRSTPLAQIGQVSGDCRPLLIPRTVTAEHLVIRIKDLEELNRNAASASRGPL